MKHERSFKPSSPVQLDIIDLLPGVKKRKIPPEIRFKNLLTQKRNGCVEFRTDDFRNGGYGRFRVGNKIWSAHQYAYFLFYGKEAKSILRHTCNNPLCCNVAHLRCGTQADNVADMVAAGRGREKLKKEQVQLIAKQYHERGVGTKALAKKYAVSEKAIVSLITGRTWSKVTGIKYTPKKPHQRKINRQAA